MTQMEASDRRWNGETSLIDRAMLSRHVGDAASAVYYVAGPPAMVKGLQQMLAKASVKHHDVRAEEFAGY